MLVWDSEQSDAKQAAAYYQNPAIIGKMFPRNIFAASHAPTPRQEPVAVNSSIKHYKEKLNQRQNNFSGISEPFIPEDLIHNRHRYINYHPRAPQHPIP